MRKIVMKTFFAASLLAGCVPATGWAASAAATTVTTIDALTTVNIGASVTITGTTTAAEVMVKVLAPDQTVLYFDVAKKNDQGRYSVSFTIPADAAAGTYSIAAGSGTDVVNGTLTVVQPSSGVIVAPYVPQVANPDQPAVFEVGSKDLPAAQNGKVIVDASGQTSANLEVKLPADLNKLLNGNSLQVNLPSGSLVVPQEVMDKLVGLIPSGADKSKTSLSLQVKRLTKEEAGAKLPASNQSTMSPQGEVLELSLSVKLPDGSVQKLSTFSAPVTLQMKASPGPDSELYGIYYISDQGAVEYVGGKLEGDKLTAQLQHFSMYGVFAYKKAYTDVPSTNWANHAIQVLSAKHIVAGLSEDRFGPEEKVTRAEFTAMLVRHLGLKPAKAAAFTDVAAGSWYAQDVAAANENGIVKGTGATTFSPNQTITREEMAAMIVRVYERAAGKAADAAASTSFRDNGEISAWAQPSVNAAVKLGLLAGRGENSFAPKGSATRAEATQVLSNLLAKE